MIQEAAKALEKDWKSESDVIIHLIDKVAKLEKLLGSCEKRVKDVDKKILVFQESQNIVKIDVTQLDSKLSQCCSQPSTGTCQHQHLLIIDWDDSGQLFLNGNEINDLKNANNRYDLDAVMLPIDAKVIAVKGTNKDDDDAGILASSSDGFISTNTSWKCSKEYEKGWVGVDFDDSKWPQASVVTSANNKPIVGISHHASWIWTDNYKPDNGDKEVFCRLKLP